MHSHRFHASIRVVRTLARPCNLRTHLAFPLANSLVSAFLPPSIGKTNLRRCRQLYLFLSQPRPTTANSHGITPHAYADPLITTMRLFLPSLAFLASFVATTQATALTYRLEAHEKACFFAHVENAGSKVAFYFAVQSGGSFDIDYRVVGPITQGESPGQMIMDKVIMDGHKERQGDFVFTASAAGEYRFCFDNEMSTFAEKIVDFEIAVG